MAICLKLITNRIYCFDLVAGKNIIWIDWAVSRMNQFIFDSELIEIEGFFNCNYAKTAFATEPRLSDIYCLVSSAVLIVDLNE